MRSIHSYAQERADAQVRHFAREDARDALKGLARFVREAEALISTARDAGIPADLVSDLTGPLVDIAQDWRGTILQRPTEVGADTSDLKCDLYNLEAEHDRAMWEAGR